MSLAQKVKVPGIQFPVPEVSKRKGDNNIFSLYPLNAVYSKTFFGESNALFIGVPRDIRNFIQDDGALNYFGDYFLLRVSPSNGFVLSPEDLAEYGGLSSKDKTSIDKSYQILGRGKEVRTFSVSETEHDGVVQARKIGNHWYSLLFTSDTLDFVGRGIEEFLGEHIERGIPLEEKTREWIEEMQGPHAKNFVIGARRTESVNPVIISKDEMEALYSGSPFSEEEYKNRQEVYLKLKKAANVCFEQHSQDQPNPSLVWDCILVSRGEEPPVRDFTPRFEMPKEFRGFEITGVNCEIGGNQ